MNSYLCVLTEVQQVCQQEGTEEPPVCVNTAQQGNSSGDPEVRVVGS